MDSILVKGNGALNGVIPIAGAKNACLTLMPATLLSDEPLTLTNAPRLSDIRTMTQLLQSLGAEVAALADGQVLAMSSHKIDNHTADYDIVRKMRASILVLGPMLARDGHAVVSLPGGCAIGARPVDLHLKALEAMGAELDLRDGYVHAKAPGGRLKGAVIEFPFVSVGATENALLAATLAKGTTVIKNAAREPEIVDLCKLLVAMGAQIEGIGTSDLTIHGVPRLHGATYRVMSDRIEAGSYACAAAITGGEVFLKHAVADEMDATLQALRDAGVGIEPPSPDWKSGASPAMLPARLGYGLRKGSILRFMSSSRGIRYLCFHITGLFSMPLIVPNNALAVRLCITFPLCITSCCAREDPT